jgi:hypothetical protein
MGRYMRRMPMRALRALSLVGSIAAALLGTPAEALAVEAQNATPDRCDADDKSCIQAWYKEYSAGMLAEFNYYAGQEDFLADMLSSPQATLLNAKLSLLMLEGGTRYSQWAYLDDEDAAQNAGLDMGRYEAIIGPCREANSAMHTVLFDLRQYPKYVASEAAQYLIYATACEKAFALPAKTSSLRSKNAPLEITPAKPRTESASSKPKPEGTPAKPKR